MDASPPACWHAGRLGGWAPQKRRGLLSGGLEVFRFLLALAVGLAAVEKVHGPLGVAGGDEDSSLVLLQHLEPACGLAQPILWPRSNPCPFTLLDRAGERLLALTVASDPETRYE